MYWKNPVQVWRRREKRYRGVGKTGKLVSWTKITSPPESFKSGGGYVVGLVNLEGIGLVVGQLVGLNTSKVALEKGVRVEGVLRRLYEDGEDGVICYGVKYRVCE